MHGNLITQGAEKQQNWPEYDIICLLIFAEWSGGSVRPPVFPDINSKQNYSIYKNLDCILLVSVFIDGTVSRRYILVINAFLCGKIHFIIFQLSAVAL